MTSKSIVIKGAREHNLKNIDVEIPRDRLVVITGLSGSGKSTLAFDTLYAEGQRRYVESLSSYARQFLGLMGKPDVDSIEGLSPAISIDQKTTSKNPRSTVGTVTEIYDYLRLLFARIGVPHCPEHGEKIQAQSPGKIASRIAEDFKGTVTILSPVVRKKKGTYEKLIEDLGKEGYVRARVDGKIVRTDDRVALERYVMHDIDVVIDRLETSDKSRLSEACENALKKSGGLLIATDGKKESSYSSKMSCPVCGMVFEELQPRMFSFNSPFGACEECHGLGIRMDFDPELIIPDRNLSIADGAIALYRNAVDGWRGQYLGSVAKHNGFTVFTPIKDLTDAQYVVLMYGSEQRMKFEMRMSGGEAHWSHTGTWEGLIPQSERLFRETKSEYRRTELGKFMRISPCSSCRGRKLKKKVLAVSVCGRNIIEVTDMAITDSRRFFGSLKLSEKDAEISRQVLKEIDSRLRFLENVGLAYLTLSRSAGTLSGGEAQRIRLATQIGSNLTGVMYILDEPSIGLHQRDNRKLIGTLETLRDLGNTVIVVEHDEETIRSADYVFDMGPGAGIHGGEIVAQGSPAQIMRCRDCLTGEYMSGKRKIDVPQTRRRPKGKILLRGCSENNLKEIDVSIPAGVLTLITGVSGSGKSTLVYEILYKALAREFSGSRERPGRFEGIEIDARLEKVVVIDQSPIGRTPRSNPATYTKLFDEIRSLFSLTEESRKRGYGPGRFSFNVEGGRCEACGGDGLIKIEMNFLPDVYVECEECRGRRYNAETLAVKYKGKDIAEVLSMSVEEALTFFGSIPSIRRKLETLDKVGQVCACVSRGQGGWRRLCG